MADPKPNLDGVTRLWSEIKKLKSDVARLGAPSGTEKRLTTERLELAIEELQQQAEELAAVVAEQQRQIAYLQGLTVSTARSVTGALDVPANSWATDARLRVSRTLRTTTGKLRITVGGTVASCAALYSIDGYVNRDDLIDSAGILDTLNSNDPAYYIGGSKVYTVEGLPLNTDLTVRTEVRGLSNAGAAARMSLIVEVIP